MVTVFYTSSVYEYNLWRKFRNSVNILFNDIFDGIL